MNGRQARLSVWRSRSHECHLPPRRGPVIVTVDDEGGPRQGLRPKGGGGGTAEGYGHGIVQGHRAPADGPAGGVKTKRARFTITCRFPPRRRRGHPVLSAGETPEGLGPIDIIDCGFPAPSPCGDGVGVGVASGVSTWPLTRDDNPHTQPFPARGGREDLRPKIPKNC